MSGVVERSRVIAEIEQARIAIGARHGSSIASALEYVETAVRGLLVASPWRPIETAKKNRTTIWAVFHPRIYPDLEPERPDLAAWNGVQVCLRHYGIVEYDDGPFDQGWGVAAPVGQGGFPDRWIAGWMPLPAAPADGGVA